MNYAMNIIEICESLQHGMSDQAHDVDIDRPYLLVDRVERAFIHKLKANTDVGFGQESTITRDDIFGVAFMHDLELTQNLLLHGRLRVDKDNLSI